MIHPPRAAHGPAGRLVRRFDLWRSRFGAGTDRLTTRPALQGIGRVARGRQMAAGRFLLHGFVIDAPGVSIWDLPLPDGVSAAGFHEFDWLDDLAAAGDRQSVALARSWTGEWLMRFGPGRGPGWDAASTGRRVLSWIDHAGMLLDGVEPGFGRAFRRTLSRQIRYLSRRWPDAPPGLPRFAALAGIVHGALALGSHDRLGAPALRALCDECAARIGADGSIASRNPEELSETLRLLVTVTSALRETGIGCPQPLFDAVAAIAPSLRVLRHADGTLARFHGGGQGVAGRLDHALALSGVRSAPAGECAMGFARIAHRRTTLIVDATAPPLGGAFREAHASTLAFELTSGRRPIVVNCGAGRRFGTRWRRAGRATRFHSTLAIVGCSSARLAAALADDSELPLADGPRDVRSEWRRSDLSTGLVAGHDGYVATHGLTHIRQLHLDANGRGLRGEDVLATVDRDDEAAFDRALSFGDAAGLAFCVRFHIHPDVLVADDGAGGISLMLRSGELWTFRHGGEGQVTIEPSVYLDAASIEPRDTRQIVISARTREYATRVSWTLAKARQTPDAVRDVVHDDAPVLA